jgi:hypothetical protein
MIEEEDEEEELKKGVSWKKIVKNIIVIALLILGVLIMYGGIDLGLDSTYTNFFIGIMLICFASFIIQYKKEDEDPIRQTLTVLQCDKCDITEVRDYEEGDFVYRKVGECPECQGELSISKIYAVKLKKETLPTPRQNIPINNP